MELHAIWNRIDQLEQLIISQAKEIDLLRRVVSSTQVVLQNSGLTIEANLPSSSSSTNKSKLALFRSPMGHIHQDSPTPPPHRYHYNSQSTTRDNGIVAVQNRTSTPPTTYKNYTMNPFVHPANAIPPVANRIVLKSATSTTLHAGTDHHEQFNNATVNSKIVKGFMSPTSQYNDSRTLPPNSRWSTGPSLLAGTTAVTTTFSDPDLVDQNKLDQAALAKVRANRFSLIELLTCFCPCFSMC